MINNKLFKVTTTGLGDFYVIASSFDEAAKATKQRLDSANYDFHGNRIVKRVEFICEEIFDEDDTQQFGGNGTKLIICKNKSNRRIKNVVNNS